MTGDLKYEQHYQMIAAASKSNEQYVIKFWNNPIELTGSPDFVQHPSIEQPDRFVLKIRDSEDPDEEISSEFEISQIEYMRKIGE